MTVNYTLEGEWTSGKPVSQAGDYIDLRAEMDITWIVSICAWPEIVNGDKPTPLRFELYNTH